LAHFDTEHLRALLAAYKKLDPASDRALELENLFKTTLAYESAQRRSSPLLVQFVIGITGTEIVAGKRLFVIAKPHKHRLPETIRDQQFKALDATYGEAESAPVDAAPARAEASAPSATPERILHNTLDKWLIDF